IALKCHPDKQGGPHASEAFKAISHAFAVLSDPNKRVAYDCYSGNEPANGANGGGCGSGSMHDAWANGRGVGVGTLPMARL
ncbi:hypothetical protein JKP88DRAFT_165544, partial [Tribonema minus]